jgi:hypothetical protein
MQCIEAFVLGDTKCAEYLYDRLVPATDDPIRILNALFSGKQKLDKGEDIARVVAVALTQSEHPYALYLKSLNEAQQGRHEEAAHWANRFLSVVGSKPHYLYAYGNLIMQVRTIIDPNYTPADDGKLSVVEKLALGDFKHNESKPFRLTLTNTGLSSLQVHDIILDCTCVRFGENVKRQFTLQPGQSQRVNFVFTADVRGEIVREVIFFSNGTNPVQYVKITANVQ